MQTTATVKINQAFYEALHWNKRFINLYGGAGSGKSYFAAQKIVYRCLQEPGHNILVCRKVKATMRNSTFALIKSILADMQISDLCTVNDTRLEFQFYNGSKILNIGIDDPEKMKSITDITSVWGEEATDFSIQDFNQLDLRLRGETKYYKQFILTYNPVSVYHWIKEQHHDKPDPRRLIIQTTYKDNEYIDDEYSEVLTNISDPTYKQIYEKGEWGDITDDLIYPSYKVAEIQGEPIHTYYGLDFGYNNPTALIRIDETKNDIYASESLYRTHLTNADLIDMLRPIVGSVTNVYCDAAEPNRIEELRRAGIRAVPARKDVALGIDYIKRFNINIHPVSVNLLDEIRNYRWLSGKDKQPIKFKDHGMDAMRYAVFTHKRQGATFR